MKEHSAPVVLAERHYGLAEGICGLLKTMFETVVIVTDETSLFEAVDRLSPALAVVELGLVRRQIAGIVQRLRAHCCELKIIFISTHDAPTVEVSVLNAGATALVIKARISTDLLPAVEAGLRGERYSARGVPGTA